MLDHLAGSYTDALIFGQIRDKFPLLNGIGSKLNDLRGLTMLVEAEVGKPWVNIAQAARIAKVSRSSIIAALRRGDLIGFCAVCKGGLPLTGPKPTHRCPRGKKSGMKVRVVLRAADASRYSPLPWAQASGMASARARAKKRRSLAG
jgi:hypothetical protein